MDEKTREQLRIDLNEVNLRMQRILRSNNPPNYRVIEHNYLNPLGKPDILPIGHTQGYYMYYEGLAKFLSLALNEGFLFPENFPPVFPDYFLNIARVKEDFPAKFM